jgi:hypothetical protein
LIEIWTNFRIVVSNQQMALLIHHDAVSKLAPSMDAYRVWMSDPLSSYFWKMKCLPRCPGARIKFVDTLKPEDEIYQDPHAQGLDELELASDRKRW